MMNDVFLSEGAGEDVGVIAAELKHEDAAPWPILEAESGDAA